MAEILRRVTIVLTQSLDPSAGGVQRTTWQMARFFEKSGLDVQIISLSADQVQVLSERIQLVTPPVDLNTAPDQQIEQYLTECLAVHRPQVVINQMALFEQPASALEKIRNDFSFKIIACFRNNPFQYKQNYKHILLDRFNDNFLVRQLLDIKYIGNLILSAHQIKTKRLFERAISRSDKFMLLAPNFMDELKWYFKHDMPHLYEKLICIPNGFEIPDFKNQLTEKKNILLYVGRLDNAQKNVMMLPDLWALLESKHVNWEMHIVGEGADRQVLEKKISELNLKRCLVFGKKTATPFFKSSKIFLMLSAFEGFGNTLIESQMHGMVPIAFDSYSAVQWILKDEVNARLIQPFDLHAYAQAVEDLMQDEPKWERMSNAAYENSLRFSAERVGKQWINVMNGLINDDAGH